MFLLSLRFSLASIIPLGVNQVMQLRKYNLFIAVAFK